MSTPTTVAEAFTRAAEGRAHDIALVDLSASDAGRSVSYADLADGVERVAGFLKGLGVSDGDAVATLLPSCRAWVETFLACASIGALLVPLNTRYRADEIGHLLDTSGATVLVTAATFEGVDLAVRVQDVAAEATHGRGVRHVIAVSGDPAALAGAWTVHRWEETRTSRRRRRPAPSSDAPVIVFGTSGTTSAPKLAIHTNATILAHLPHVAARLGLGPDLPLLSVLSLSGTFGWVPFTAGLLAGGRSVLLPIYQRERVLAALAQYPSGLIVAAEGSLRDLFESVGDRSELGGLKRAVTAGLSIDDIVRTADPLGVTVQNVYGSSEVFAFAATAPAAPTAEDRRLPGGHVVAAGVAARVVDTDGVPVPAGEIGELQVAGDAVFVSYLANPEATATAFTTDGWFRTGDSARMIDERAFEYLARANDTLRLGGYSTSPADVESTIERLDGVVQAQVVGVRDDRTGDDLGVAFVRVDDPSVDEARLSAWCREHLASYKVPTAIVVVDEYPSTPSANGDKVRRDVLRKRAGAVLVASGAEGAR